MEFTTTFSRTDLKSLHARRKATDLMKTVDSIAIRITDAAEKGDTQSTLTQTMYDEIRRIHFSFLHLVYIPTLTELVVPLRLKFPGTDVVFVEELIEDTYPRGTFRKVQKIIINWS